MVVSKKLAGLFNQLKPDLHTMEMTEERCCQILTDLIGERMEKKHVKKEDDVEGLKARIKLLQEELKNSLSAADDIGMLKAKAAHIMEQFTRERDRAQAAEGRQAVVEKKMTMLTLHLEKYVRSALFYLTC